MHTYINSFFTLSPWRNLWNTSHSKAPWFPMWNFNRRRFIAAPLKGISTMLTEPVLHARFWSTRKRLLHESSIVFVEEVWNVICLLHGKRGYLLPLFKGGRARDEETDTISDYCWACTACSWDTVSNPAVPLVQQAQSWPLVYQRMLPLVQKFKLRRLQRFVAQSLLFSFSFKKTPGGGTSKKLYGEAHITEAWKSYPFRAELTCTCMYRPL